MRKLIESRLQTAWGAGADPLRGDYELNPTATSGPGSKLVPAAVLVPIIDRPDGLTVLLTKRTDHLHDHAGQVSFPGGRAEAEDEGPVDTALRETEEEIGLARSFISIVSPLAVYETVTGFEVTPVVGFVEPGFSLTLDDFEVAEAFEVPLDFIFDPANHRRESRMWNGIRRHFFVIPYEGHYIWGATAGMLVNLYRKVLG